MSDKYPNEPRLFSYMAKFYDLVSNTAKIVYLNTFHPQKSFSKETAQKNLDGLVQQLVAQIQKDEQRAESYLDYFNPKSPQKRSKNFQQKNKQIAKQSIEEMLSSLGDNYIYLGAIKSCSKDLLWKFALQYDLKGIIPAPNEELTDLVYRGNTLLFLNRTLRKMIKEFEIDKENTEIAKSEIKLKLSHSLGFVLPEDLEEANKRIPYFMDLTWVASYVKDSMDMIIPALGITFTLPNYDGFNFIHMRDEYKSREQFLNVLSHEMVHAGTVYLDTKKDFLETKAYAVGKGSLLLGEYVVALNERPGIIWLVLRNMAQWGFGFTLPDSVPRALAKVRSAARIMTTTSTYQEVKGRLQNIYRDKGGYILGRLNAEEMDELCYTNDVTARIEQKEDLKWRIMNENLAVLLQESESQNPLK